MSCAIQAGYTIGCVDSVGGIKAIYLITYDEITSMTDASGVITGITKDSGKRFWKFELPSRSTANATSNPVGSLENGTLFFQQQLTFPINKRDATTRNIVATIVKNRVIAVTEDKDGSFRMYGKMNGLFSAASTGQTGAAAGDANGYTIVLEGDEKEDFFVVNSTVAAALETPGS
jgi:hypothetical protein